VANEPSTGNSKDDVSADEEAVMVAVRDALRAIEYGSVLITIHQGEVVGMETSTKVRLKGR
jgi:hypothetical protein